MPNPAMTRTNVRRETMPATRTAVVCRATVPRPRASPARNARPALAGRSSSTSQSAAAIARWTPACCQSACDATVRTLVARKYRSTSPTDQRAETKRRNTDQSRSATIASTTDATR